MCRMTEDGFRWQAAIPIPLTTATWYVYENKLFGARYSDKCNVEFKPLYAIRIKAATKPLRTRMKMRRMSQYIEDGFTQ